MAGELPELTCCVLTYKSPDWGILTLLAMRDKVSYAGPKRFVVADGGSPEWQLDLYRRILQGLPHTVVQADNLADQFNLCAHHAGEVWFYALDDFVPMAFIDITPDVRMLLAYPEAGLVRMGRLAFWECRGANTGFPNGIHAEMVASGGLHWWITDKARSVDPYLCSLNAGVMHRRMWDAYGPLPPVHPHRPGEAELVWSDHYNRRAGPSVAIPVRFGENDTSTRRANLEPVQHLRPIHGDDYMSEYGGRGNGNDWAAT